MTWEDRLAKPYYRSPSGRQAYFDFEDLTETVNKRAKVWSFRGLALPYIQEFGIGNRRIPMRCIFSGPDCDRLASVFLDMLGEAGIGELGHPLRGVRKVVPLGDFDLSEPIKSAGNQAIVDVEFWLAGGLQPSSRIDAQAIAQQQITQGSAASADVFRYSVNVSTPDAEFDLLARVQGNLAKVDRWVGQIAKSDEATRAAYLEKIAIVNSSLTTLIGNPLALAGQIVETILLPAQAAATIGLRLQGYLSLLLDLLFASPADEEPELVVHEADNDIATTDLFARGVVLACVQILATSQPATRGEAIGAVEQAEAIVIAHRDWVEEIKQTHAKPDTGEGVEILQLASSTAIGRVIGLVATLLVEKSMVLDRDWALLELCAKIKRSVDEETLDAFVMSNRLGPDEMVIIPKGRRVVWYG